jgi:hypothetical protein
VTLTLIEAHLSGSSRFVALGYLPAQGDATPVGMIDLDAKDFPEPGGLEDARLRLLDVAEALGLIVFVEASTRGGWHVFIFTDEPLPFTLMRRALKAWARRAGLGGIEVYPMGDDAPSRWYIMPYAGAAKDPQRLGRTFLATSELEPIPYGELGEWLERTPAEKVRALASEYREPKAATYSRTEPLDLAPEALELLKTAANHPPDNFNRHDSLRAFMNLAKRCGREGDMVSHLKTDRVRQAWAKDESRGTLAWEAEIDRWTKAKPSAHERGILYLVEQGFTVPDLPTLRSKRFDEQSCSSNQSPWARQKRHLMNSSSPVPRWANKSPWEIDRAR